MLPVLISNVLDNGAEDRIKSIVDHSHPGRKATRNSTWVSIPGCQCWCNRLLMRFLVLITLSREIILPLYVHRVLMSHSIMLQAVRFVSQLDHALKIVLGDGTRREVPTTSKWCLESAWIMGGKHWTQFHGPSTVGCYKLQAILNKYSRPNQ